MSRTPTLSPNDKTMWRKLVARAHPDAGGTHDLFVWSMATREAVCGGELGSEIPRHERREHPSRQREASTSGVDRVPFDPGQDFAALTGRALRYEAGDYGRILALLNDCWPLDHLAHEQNRGASYKRLAAIGHAWGMSKAERVRWYRVAEGIPLSDRHAGHILGRSKERAA